MSSTTLPASRGRRSLSAVIALGFVFWAGVLFFLISVTPVRVAVARAIPTNLRIASTAGIGILVSKSVTHG